MPLDLTDDKSTLVQVMAWCFQSPSHYLSQCWPRSLSPYGVTRPQWVKTAFTVMFMTLIIIQITCLPSNNMFVMYAAMTCPASTTPIRTVVSLLTPTPKLASNVHGNPSWSMRSYNSKMMSWHENVFCTTGHFVRGIHWPMSDWWSKTSWHSCDVTLNERNI